MSEPIRLWIVEVGEYSSRETVAVFDDVHKAEAERYADLVGGTVLEDALTLNPTIAMPPPGMTYYSVTMDRSGNAKTTEYHSLLSNDGTHLTGQYQLATHQTSPWERKSHWRLWARLYAKNEAHAVKIVNEIRAQIVAGAKPPEGTIP